MLKRIKTQMVQLLKELGYNATDNGDYVELFPWLMVRTSDHQRLDTFDMRIDGITLIIDVFSKYQGEQEIIDIADNIANNIKKIKEDNSSVIFIYQKGCKIIDDDRTGPVRKHGIITYQFLLTSGLEAASE